MNNFQTLSDQLSKTLGINEKDALAYLTLYRLGNQTANILGKHLGINRTTMNSLLERMWEKGLVKKHPTIDAVTYSAVRLDEIEALFNEKIEQTKQKKEKFKGLKGVIKQIDVPSFEKNIPKVFYYEGLTQAKKALLKILKSVKKGGEILSYVNVAKRDQSEFKSFWPRYYQVRIDNNIFMRQISPDVESCRLHASKDKEELRQTKLLPYADFPFEADFEINILPDSFVSILLKPECPVVTIYEDRIGARAMKNIFEHHWSLIK